MNPLRRERGLDIPPETDWGMLMRGQTVGKTAGGLFIPANSVQAARGPNIDVLQLKGDSHHALAVCVTLIPPQALPPGVGLTGDVQNVSGTQDNESFLNNAAANQLVYANPVALVKWGNGGVECEAKVDVANGARLFLTTSFLRVKFGIETADSAPTLSQAVYQVGAFVGPGTSRDWSAQYSKDLGNIADTDSSDIVAVPKFAKRVYALAFNADPTILPALAIQFFRDGQAVEGVNTTFLAGNNTTPAPVPNGAYYYTVNNQSGDTMRVLTVFELGL